MVSHNRIQKPIRFTLAPEVTKKRYAIILLPSNEVAENDLNLHSAVAWMGAFNRSMRGTVHLATIVDQRSIGRYVCRVANQKRKAAVG